MSIRNLDALFAPTNIAVIGASDRPASVGRVVMHNLLDAGFEGQIFPVNPRHDTVAGKRCVAAVRDLPAKVDLGVICTPAATVPGLVHDLVAGGARAAIIMSAGLRAGDLENETFNAARPGLLRMLGPNCIGLLVPGCRLNASFTHLNASPGRLAFVSQSGAFCTAVLDWAKPRNIGFSHFISLGDSLDVDLADVLDYLGGDARTSAILVYAESITRARKFMSAARAAARNKPVILLKAGRVEAGARAAASHTGALAGADAVYDAALARAGVLRVDEIEELFEAAETLERSRGNHGEHLAILTNGGGPGVTATDALVALAGKECLVELSEATRDKLAGALPAAAATANPVDIIGDAPAERFSTALEILLNAPEVDGVLVLHAPTALSSSREAAQAVVQTATQQRGQHNLFAAWLGQQTAAPARDILRDAAIPTFDTPHSAVRAFWHRVRYGRNQAALLETPPVQVTETEPDHDKVERVLSTVRKAGRTLLSEVEAKAILAAYGIPVVATETAEDLKDARRIAERIGYPVALKILSPDITHKTDVGGVALDLADGDALTKAGEDMLQRVQELSPQAELQGFTVQAMVRRPGCFELLAGVSTDPVFGPVVVFGEGGTDVELIRDRALALPPLNGNLAGNLIQQTRIARRFVASRGRKGVDQDALQHSLVQLSQLIVDLPAIAELDINPLLADTKGVIALDARIRLAEGDRVEPGIAILPYPRQLEETVTLEDGAQLLVRPIRPEDEAAQRDFFSKLTRQDVRFRFFGAIREMPHSQLARETQIDYDREMAFVAIPLEGPEQNAIVGVVRAILDSDYVQAECAVIVRSSMRGRGLGRALIDKIIRYCRNRGVKEVIGQVAGDNYVMLRLTADLGFKQSRPADGIVEMSLKLD